MKKKYDEMCKHIDKITKNKKYSNQKYKYASGKLNKIFCNN